MVTRLDRVIWRVKLVCAYAENLWRRMLAPMAWVPVEFTCTREVEINSVTGAYRWRRIRYAGNNVIEGNWQSGQPEHFALDPLFSEEDRAAVLSHEHAMARVRVARHPR